MSTKVLNFTRAAGIAAGVIGAVAVSPAFALTCNVVPSSGTWDGTIAVASNFYGPAQDMIADFTASGAPGFGKHIRICHDSTGVLNSEIRSGNSNHYSLFLAANATTPQGLQSSGFEQSGATAQSYAQGIPVLFARKATVTDVSTLVPSQSGDSATISSNSLTSHALDTTNAATVAVADPTPAPYGNAAFKVMAGMGLFSYTTPGTEPNPLPAYLSSKYSNIDLTFQSVAASPYPNKSGFVSKAQICGGIGGGSPTYVYVAFTGSNYLLDQKGILIASGDGTDSIGSDVFDWMLSNPSGTYWSTFLTNHCYM